jgi:hypothetical protein
VANLRVSTFMELNAATKNIKSDTGGLGKGWVDERTMNPARSGAAYRRLEAQSREQVCKNGRRKLNIFSFLVSHFSPNFLNV